MKKILGIGAAILAIAAAPALAQEATSGSASQSGVVANIQGAAGASNTNTFVTPETVNYRGRYEVLTPGGANAPAVFSGTHPCVVGGSIGLAGVVGDLTGLSAGGTMTDEECTIRMEAMVLAGMGMTQDAIMHLAIHDESLRRTLLATGKVRLPSEVSRDVQMTTSSSFVPEPAYRKCEKRADGALLVTVKRGSDKATAIAQCKALH